MIEDLLEELAFEQAEESVAGANKRTLLNNEPVTKRRYHSFEHLNEPGHQGDETTAPLKGLEDVRVVHPFALLSGLYGFAPDSASGQHPFNYLAHAMNDYNPTKRQTEVIPVTSWREQNPFRINPMNNEEIELDMHFEDGLAAPEMGRLRSTYTTGAYLVPGEQYYKRSPDYARDRVLVPKNDFTLDSEQAVFFVPEYNLLEQGLWGFTYIGQGKIHHEMHFPNDYKRVDTITHEANHTPDEYETRRRNDARMDLAPDHYATRTLNYSRTEMYARQISEQISVSRPASVYLGANYHPTPGVQAQSFVRHPWPPRHNPFASVGTIDDVVRKAA